MMAKMEQILLVLLSAAVAASSTFWMTLIRLDERLDRVERALELPERRKKQKIFNKICRILGLRSQERRQ